MGVDTWTVQWWCAGARVPCRKHRVAVAQLLDTEERYLWPELPAPAVEPSPTDVMSVYSNPGAVPQHLWMSVFQRATSEIGILAYATNWLPEQHIGLVPLLRRKAEVGCRARVALGDPMSAKLDERRYEERLGRGIANRVKNAFAHYRPLLVIGGVSVHTHETTLYESMFRADDELLVNTHVFGVGAYMAPVLHLHRRAEGGIFDTYAGSFEEVARRSRPLATDSDFHPRLDRAT